MSLVSGSAYYVLRLGTGLLKERVKVRKNAFLLAVGLQHVLVKVTLATEFTYTETNLHFFVIHVSVN